MNVQLNHIHNWAKRSLDAHYIVAELAVNLGVGIRTLEKFILSEKGVSPRDLLAAHCMKRMVALLKGGLTVKEVAAQLGYKQPHLSRACKNFSGVPPSRLPA